MRRLARALLAGAVLSAATGAVARAVVPRRGRMVQAGGRRLRVIAEGPRGAPLAVLVHGLGGQAENFARLMPLLAGWRVLAVDRPGAGRADPAPPGGAELPVQAAAIAALIEAEGRPAVILGHSLGGAVALQLAADRPDLVAGLVLAGALTRPEHLRLAIPTDRLAALPPLREGLARTVAVPGMLAATPWLVRLIFWPQRMPAGFLRWGGGLLAGQPKAASGMLRDIAVVARGIGALQDRLPGIAAPTVILHGRQDQVLHPDRHGAHLAALLPHARLQVVEGAGHMLPVCNPGLCAEAIRSLR